MFVTFAFNIIHLTVNFHHLLTTVGYTSNSKIRSITNSKLRRSRSSLGSRRVPSVNLWDTVEETAIDKSRGCVAHGRFLYSQRIFTNGSKRQSEQVFFSSAKR